MLVTSLDNDTVPPMPDTQVKQPLHSSFHDVHVATYGPFSGYIRYIVAVAQKKPRKRCPSIAYNEDVSAFIILPTTLE